MADGNLPPELQQKALRLRDAKWPVKAIAKMIGTSDNNMHRIFRECDHD